MCGICCIYNLNQRKVLKETIEEMKRTLVNRGLDDEGTYLDGAIGLGFIGLSLFLVQFNRIQEVEMVIFPLINKFSQR